jgi:hypothetical protein
MPRIGVTESGFWPTASFRDYKGPTPDGCMDRRVGTEDLARAAVEFTLSLHPDAKNTDGDPLSRSDLTLNPLFVEWLMGLPLYWTRPTTPTGSRTAVKRWSHYKRQLRSALSTVLSGKG